MTFNILVLLGAAVIPLLIGFIWYHPKVFGNAWMRASGVTAEQVGKGNMAVIFGLTFLLSFLLATAVNSLVIHQNHMYSILMNEPGFEEDGSEVKVMIDDFMARYGDNFRTFRHGVVHGVLNGIFFVLPIIGILALFERRSFRYVALHTGYWIVTLALMGGVICAFS